MKKILLVLFQPYPYNNAKEKVPKNTLAIFLLVFLFLYLFSPFGITKAEQLYSYPVICAIHALNAAMLYFLFCFFINKLTNISAKEDNWKVYNEILLVSLVLLLIGLGSFLVRPLIYNNPDNFSWYYFMKETGNTFLAGTVIFSAFILVDYHRLLKTNRDKAADFEKEIEWNRATVQQVEKTEELKTILLTIEKEPYHLNTSEFLFAKAEGNYITFYLNRNYTIVKEQKRASLKNIEEQIGANTPFILKTHRAFIVNARHIKKMTGNAQGYQLFFENIDFPVPVSRAMLPGFRLAIKAK
jgi:hypothetical protein